MHYALVELMESHSGYDNGIQGALLDLHLRCVQIQCFSRQAQHED